VYFCPHPHFSDVSCACAFALTITQVIRPMCVLSCLLSISKNLFCAQVSLTQLSCHVNCCNSESYCVYELMTVCCRKTWLYFAPYHWNKSEKIICNCLTLFRLHRPSPFNMKRSSYCNQNEKKTVVTNIYCSNSSVTKMSRNGYRKDANNISMVTNLSQWDYFLTKSQQ
jgi:hypothetical protein